MSDFYTDRPCPTPGCPMRLRRSVLEKGVLCCPRCLHREPEPPPGNTFFRVTDPNDPRWMKEEER